MIYYLYLEGSLPPMCPQSDIFDQQLFKHEFSISSCTFTQEKKSEFGLLCQVK